MTQRRLPTRRHVVALHQRFPLAPGTVITWEALETAMAPLQRTQRRFRTIYQAWIRDCEDSLYIKLMPVRDLGLVAVDQHVYMERLLEKFECKHGQIMDIYHSAMGMVKKCLTAEQQHDAKEIWFALRQAYNNMASLLGLLCRLPSQEPPF